MVIGTHQIFTVHYDMDMQQKLHKISREIKASIAEATLKLANDPDILGGLTVQKYKWGFRKGEPICEVAMVPIAIDEENMEMAFYLEIHIDVKEDGREMDEYRSWLQNLIGNSCPYSCDVAIAPECYYIGN